MTFVRLLAALSVATPLAAQGFEDLPQLESRIAAELGAGMGEAGGPARQLDRRLKLAACPTAPVVSAPTPAAAVVQCQPRGWRIHVPLVRASITQQAKAEPVIRKGDQVEVVAGGSGFTVSMLGVAQQDGAQGERIRVRSDGKAVPIIAKVDAPGRVMISGLK